MTIFHRLPIERLRPVQALLSFGQIRPARRARRFLTEQIGRESSLALALRFLDLAYSANPDGFGLAVVPDQRGFGHAPRWKVKWTSYFSGESGVIGTCDAGDLDYTKAILDELARLRGRER